MKWIKNELKIIQNRLFLFFGIIIVSCSQDGKCYFLKNQYDKNCFFEIIKKKDSIFIYEHYKDNKRDLRMTLLKYNDGYVNILCLKQKKKDTINFFFLSKSKSKYLITDRFSLLNDSVITGNKEGGMFYTEIKANEKPVNYRYYHNENFEIKKIVLKIGKDIYLFE